MKIILALLLLTTPALAQKQEMPRRNCRACKITREYDRFKNQTHFILTPFAVAEVVEGQMFLGVAGGYKGETPGAEKVFAVSITFIAKTALGADDSELFALVDGKPASLGVLALASRNTLGYLHAVTYTTTTTRADLSKISVAKKTEMRFGGIEFSLTLEHQIAILDLLANVDGAPVR